MRAPDLVRRIEAVAADAEDHHAFREAADAMLRRALGYDVAAWASLDPATLLFTSCDVITPAGPGGNTPEAERALFASEFAGEDPLTFAKILQSGRRVTRLRAEVEDPSRVERFRSLIEPNGGSDEMRILAADRWGVWGAIIAYRSRGRAPFGPEEQRLAEALAPALAAPIRHAFLRAAALDGATARAPGTLTLGRDARPLVASEPAEAWLGTLMRSQVTGAFQALTQLVAREGAARLTVLGNEGPVAFHAHPRGEEPSSLDVIVERPRPVEMAEVIMAAHELTPAEAAVTRLLCQGRTNRQIADALEISSYTVQDHLKAVFAKFEVGSRSEVLHRLYTQHYVPLRSRDAMPGPYGYFLRPDAAAD